MNDCLYGEWPCSLDCYDPDCAAWGENNRHRYMKDVTEFLKSINNQV